jgi:DNA primase
MTGVIEQRERTAARVAAVKAGVSLAALIGQSVKLRKIGREYVGLCPFHNEKSPSFSVVEDKGFYHCFGCGAHGDVISFKVQHDGLAFPDALAALEADSGLAAASAIVQLESKREVQKPSRYIESRAAAAVVWQAAGPARGTIAENWLRARGIDPDASGALDVIRFHPRCPAALWREWEHPDYARRNAPALVTPFLRVVGAPSERALRLTGVHLTFLSGDGRSKAYFEAYRERRTGSLVHPPTRVFWGSAKGGAVLMPARPLEGGADVSAQLIALLDDVAAGPLLVAEGLESTLSAMRRVPAARMGCATLSLLNLQGGAAGVGTHNALPLWDLVGDPDSPPFLVDAPGAVVLGVDADMKPENRWVQERRGQSGVKRALSSLERSQICAGLAAWHWRRAGAEPVTTMRPPMGCDFNDLDQGGRHAG